MQSSHHSIDVIYLFYSPSKYTFTNRFLSMPTDNTEFELLSQYCEYVVHFQIWFVSKDGATVQNELFHANNTSNVPDSTAGSKTFISTRSKSGEKAEGRNQSKRRICMILGPLPPIHITPFSYPPPSPPSTSQSNKVKFNEIQKRTDYINLNFMHYIINYMSLNQVLVF